MIETILIVCLTLVYVIAIATIAKGIADKKNVTSMVRVKLKRGSTKEIDDYDIEKYEVVFDAEREKAVIGTGDGKYIDLSDCEKVNSMLAEFAVEKGLLKEAGTHLLR